MFRPSRLFARAGGPQWTAVVWVTGLVAVTAWPLPAQESGDETAQDGADEGTKPAGDAGRNAAWTKIEQDAEKSYREPLKTGGGL